MAINGVGLQLFMGFGWGDVEPQPAVRPPQQEQEDRLDLEELKYLGAKPVYQHDYSFGVSPPKDNYWPGGSVVSSRAPSPEQVAAKLLQDTIATIKEDGTLNNLQKAERIYAVKAFGAPWRDGYARTIEYMRMEGSLPVIKPLAD